MEEQKEKYHPKKWRGQRFCMTIHGQHESDLAKLQEFFDSDAVKCACISKEFGKQKIHPHWQIYFELTNETQKIKTEMTDLLGHERFHVKKADGTKEQNVSYVFGVNKYYEGGFVVYRKNVKTPWNYNEEPVVFWNKFKPRPFQQDVIDLALTAPDRRTIYWFYDTIGNTGKTIVSEYLHIFHGAIITGGKNEDMKNAITRWQETTESNPKIIIMDLARSDIIGDTTFRGIESIKNGLFFDGKYESAMVHSFAKPHVFIFSNYSPEKYMDLFSKDRWKIFNIVDNQLVDKTQQFKNTNT